MSVGHYENFPVASILLPRHLRRPVAVIYRFARSADDFADEGDDPAATRLESLDHYRRELQAIERGAPTQLPLFSELAAVIEAHRLPVQPFFDLLDAFSQDVVKKRYANFDELREYCRRSADPVGRLMLRLYRVPEAPQDLSQSDAICTALQLANFWQDVEIDFAKDRIYLPQEEMARFGVSEAGIAARDAGGGWPELMRFQTQRARALLVAGAPLSMRLQGRIALELRMIVQGGLRVLEKIDRVGADVFRRRPGLRAWDWPLMLGRALVMRES